ncbi:MAG: hypothetical protein NZ519_10195 [Bacteroidia bacterium]|nr:hypothetical protein [Bacteroidia bacterium]MDW8301061.1 hypothetical protein [Bacteroidia bacterium]
MQHILPIIKSPTKKMNESQNKNFVRMPTSKKLLQRQYFAVLQNKILFHHEKAAFFVVSTIRFDVYQLQP